MGPRVLVGALSAQRLRRRRGYTVLELMTVVAVLGSLTTIALPIYRGAIGKAKRSEAILALSAVFTFQQVYRANHGIYADSFDEMGFELMGAVRVDERTWQGRTYTYTVQALERDGAAAGNFRALATGDLDPSTPMLDILMIENDIEIGE